ncbi:MAG: hypothetical protein P1V51_07855 [Deltaproteobacteria bacterium]|nr:hypothetical protein [Deltaproteobacteria bacterium]
MGRVIKPYEWLYELKPIPIKEKVLEEVVRHILEELKTWPPPVTDWESEAAGQRFAPLYEEPRPPTPALWRRALQLVRWEMEREFEAIDETMRNERWREDDDHAQAHAALLLIWQWLTELLLAVREHSQQSITRSDLVRVVDLLEPKLAPDPLRTREG